MGVGLLVIHGLSLCSGIGGLECGLKLALGDAYRTVCFVEREAFCAAALVARMEDQAVDLAPIWDDLATFDGRPWRGKVDLVSGGYPCQPFSVAGRRAGEEDERHLWPHIKRILEEVRPPLAFFENVPGHLVLGFRSVLRDLERLGYRTAAALVTAEEVGAPHRRERLFFLAHRAVQGLPLRESSREVGAPPQDGGGPINRTQHNGRADVDESAQQRLEGDGEPREHALQRISWPPGPEGDWSFVPEWLWPAVGNRAKSGSLRAEQLEYSQEDQRGGRRPDTHTTGDLPGRPRGDEAPPEPELRGVAAKLPAGLDASRFRVDRLRALGNAVVPVQAAHAFRICADALNLNLGD